MGTLALVGIAGNSMVEGAGFSISELSSSGAIQGTGESKWPLGRLFGQTETVSLGDSDLWRTLATDSILPRHNFDMQVGGYGGAGMGAFVGGQPGVLGVKAVPFLMLAERYDSNVFFAPALLGLKRQDYVTSFNPGIFFLHNSQVVRTTFQMGATGEYFALHPGLNYVGFNGVLTLSMNELARRVAPGATFLVAQSVNYSPVVPGFQSGVDSSAAQSTPADDQPDVTTALVRSQQLYRVNTLSASSTVAGSVPLTPSVLFQANYGYSTFRFGTPSVNEATGTTSARVINSTSHSAQAGPAWRITSSDTISLKAVFEHADYGGGQGGYQAWGGSLGWARRISQNFNFRLYGGATTVDQSFGASLGQTAPTQGIAYTGGVSVVYVGGPQTVNLTYTTGIAPSFISAVGPIQSHIGQLVATRRLTEGLSLSGGLTYNHSQAVNGAINVPGTFFESYSGYGGITYRFSGAYLASLSYTAGTYRGNYFTPDILIFGRNAVTLTISTAWF